jgi:hypothetical protein
MNGSSALALKSELSSTAASLHLAFPMHSTVRAMEYAQHSSAPKFTFTPLTMTNLMVTAPHLPQKSELQ